MISDEVMAEIRYSFQTGADNETLVFNDEDEKNRFWEWFQNESEHFDISNSPNQSLVGVENVAGRCFGNSQTICLNHNLDYSEGFLKTNNDFYFHGFNLNVEGHVEDYTALSHPDVFGTGSKEYYGVLIDNDFICENNLEVLVEGAMNIPHLLYLYFRHRTF